MQQNPPINTPTWNTALTLDEGSYMATWSPSFTVNAGHSNNYLLIALSDHAFPTSQPTSVKYAGATMSLIGAGEVGATANDYFLYGLANPATGSNAFTITTGGSTSNYTGEAVSWYNVNQTTPYGSFQNAHNNATSLASLAFTGSEPGRVVTDFVWIDAQNIILPVGKVPQ